MLAAAVSIAALFGGIAPPLDALTILAPVLLALGALFALVLAFAWRGLVKFWASAVTATCAALIVWPEIVESVRAPVRAGNYDNAITLAALNVWDDNRDPAYSLAILRRARPDIIVLTEARAPLLLAMRKTFADYPTQIVCPESPYGGVAIFSRLPARPDAGGAPLALPPTTKPMPAPLNAAVARLVAGGREFPVVAVHLTRDGLGPRADQAGRLAALVGNLPDSGRAIVAGDFNTNCWSFGMRNLDEALAPRRATHLLLSWPTPSLTRGITAPFACIDHIFAGKDWMVPPPVRGPDVGSDHYPVLVQLIGVTSPRLAAAADVLTTKN